jgi:hypothetical protein
MVVIGKLTNKPTARKVMGDLESDDTLPPRQQSAVPSASPLLLAVYWNDRQDYDHPPLHWALYAFGRELIRTSEYILWLPALLGLWWFRERWRTVPGMWIVYILGLIYGLALCRVAMKVGYLAERHALFLVLLGMPWTVAGLERIGEKLALWLDRRLSPRLSWGRAWLRGTTLAALLAVVFLAGVFKPLHANRAGHRAAGEWLAAHVHPGDEIVDPFCWAHFYAGAVFREGRDVAPALAAPAMCYVVLENSKNPHARLPLMVRAQELAKDHVPVYRWIPKPSKSKDRAEEVVVYAVPAQP